jgi:hypothetical protein
MNPTDCAMTSGRDRTFAPRRSYPASCFAILASFYWAERAVVPRGPVTDTPAPAVP